MPEQLRLCALNAENLVISLEYRDGEDLGTADEEQWRRFALPQLRRMQKPLARVLGLAEALLEIDPDIVMLSEVGGEDSLQNFNRHFLADRFEPFFVEGNSVRGMDLAFLVRRGLPFDVEALSNRELPVALRGGRARFSRDVAELRLWDGDALRLVVLLVHLKSKLSAVGDVGGRALRTAEATALTEHYLRRRSEFPGVPIVVGGDFNAPLQSQELELLASSGLTDFHDLLGTPPEDRVSIVHFDLAGEAHPETIDYLLVSPELRASLVPEGSFTWRYRSAFGIPSPLPTSAAGRYRMPSDHFPLVLTLALPPKT